MEKGTVAIPVEIAARELDAKILLSAIIAQSGHPVALGYNAEMRLGIDRLSPAAYLSHTLCMRRKYTRIMNGLGIRLHGWDEEGLMWPSASYYLERRVDALFAGSARRIYCWGERQRDALATVTDPDRLVVAGNPRVDVLRPEFHVLHAERVRQLRERYGRFVLVNSNFGSVNHFHGGRFRPTIKHSPAYLEERRRVLEAMIEAIHALSRRLEHSIVVRLHPSESETLWKEAFGQVDKVHVVYDNDLIAWLLACDVLVHNNCTTALEYFLLHRIPISYDPLPEAQFENALSSLVSLHAHSIDELVALIERVGSMDAEAHFNERKAAVNHHLRLDDELSAACIARSVVADLQAPGPRPGTPDRLRARVQAWLLRLSHGARMLLSPSYRHKQRYMRHKFSASASRALVQERLDAFCDILKLNPCQVEALPGFTRVWLIRRRRAAT